MCGQVREILRLNGHSLCRNCFSELHKNKTCPVCGYSGGGSAGTRTALPRGKKLKGRYITGGVLGSGGFGITYIAYDLRSCRAVALKEYFPNAVAVRAQDGSVCPSEEKNEKLLQNGVERFYCEAEYVFQFNGNPNIVNVFDYFYANNTAYLAMEYLSGITLENYVKAYGALSQEQTVYIAEKLSMALIVMHSAKLLHRDISPDNIMLCRDGRVALFDFGAARELAAQELPKLTVIMKTGFSPAESYTSGGDFGEWTDIYSLGAVLYYALTGRVPMNPYERMLTGGGLDFGAGSYDGGLCRMIAGAMEISASERCRSALQLKKEISMLKIKGREIHVPDDYNSLRPYSDAVRMNVAGEPRRLTRARRAVFAGAAALACLTAFFLGVEAGAGRRAEREARPAAVFFAAGKAGGAPEHVRSERADGGDEPNVPAENLNGGAEQNEPAENAFSVSYTEDGAVRLEYDSEYKGDLVRTGDIPVSLLESFGGDVKITLETVYYEEADGGVSGFFPVDGAGANMIGELRADGVMWNDKNGWIALGFEDTSYEFVITGEGIGKLDGGLFGFEAYNLSIKSVTLEKPPHGRFGSRYYFWDYSDNNAEAVVSSAGGRKVVTAELEGGDTKFKTAAAAGKSVPKSAFLEFDGDVLVTLNFEHTGGGEEQSFHVWNNGGLWEAINGKIRIRESVDYKNGKIYLRMDENEMIFPDASLTECSIIVPRDTVNKMDDGIFFQAYNMTIKNVRLEDYDSTADENGGAYDNVKN